MMMLDQLARIILLFGALWSAGHLVASRWMEIRARLLTKRGDIARAEICAERAHNLQDFSRLMPSWLLILFTLALVIRIGVAFLGL